MKTYDIDDGIDRDAEFKAFEEEQKKVAERKKEKKIDERKEKLLKMDAKSEKQFKNRDTVLLWGPVLITGPLVPAFFAMWTMVDAHTTVQWHYIPFTDQCNHLFSYTIGCAVMSYLFIFVYMSIIIGPQCCARAFISTTLLFVWMGLFLVVFLALNMYGAWAVFTLYNPCTTGTTASITSEDENLVRRQFKRTAGLLLFSALSLPFALDCYSRHS